MDKSQIKTYIARIRADLDGLEKLIDSKITEYQEPYTFTKEELDKNKHILW